MNYLMKHWWLAFTVFVAAIVVVGSVSGDLCKWVDEHGTVHYAESCPEGVNSVSVEIESPPSQAQVAEAQKRAMDAKRILSNRKSSEYSRPEKVRSLSLSKLGPLPDNTTSTYLKTTGTGINLSTGGQGQFNLFLQARNSMPSNAYLEAHFPVPGSAGQKQVVEKSSVNKGDVILLRSDESSEFKCWNYQVEVFVYADQLKTELLDVHQQTIQSRLDNDLINGNLADFVTEMFDGSHCPADDKQDMKNMSVEQLDALCESEREKRLKPEREKLIKDCIKRGDKQDEWCENYYADWGDAQRIDRALIRPALYYNLPECIAAREAREK